MNTIRIRKTIQSDTLQLPELEALVGHTVDIIIEDLADQTSLPPGVKPGMGDWDTVLAEAQQLENYDYEAQRDQDACDSRDAEDRFK